MTQKTIVIACSLFAVSIGSGAAFAATEKQEAQNKIATLKELVARPGFFARPKTPRKVLIVSQAYGYRHEKALEWGAKVLALVAEQGAFPGVLLRVGENVHSDGSGKQDGHEDDHHA